MKKYIIGLAASITLGVMLSLIPESFYLCIGKLLSYSIVALFIATETITNINKGNN